MQSTCGSGTWTLDLVWEEPHESSSHNWAHKMVSKVKYHSFGWLLSPLCPHLSCIIAPGNEFFSSTEKLILDFDRFCPPNAFTINGRMTVTTNRYRILALPLALRFGCVVCPTEGSLTESRTQLEHTNSFGETIFRCTSLLWSKLLVIFCYWWVTVESFI